MDFNDQQIKTLRDLSFERFINEDIHHIKITFPLLATIFNDDNLRTYVKQGVSLAKASGITQRGPVRLYIDTMIILGSQFEHNHLWPKFIYNKKDKIPQIENSMAIYTELQNYNKKVNGDEGFFYKASIEKLNNIDINHIYNEHHKIHDLLNYIHPQKYQFISREGVDHLISQVENYSNIHNSEWFKNKAYISLISFLFGCFPDGSFYRESIIMDTLNNFIINKNVKNHSSLVTLYSSLQLL